MPGTAKVTVLPHDFIGKEDEARLESFASHLIACGFATRWHWERSRGFDVSMELYRGGANEELIASIRRDSSRDLYYAKDASGRRIVEGSLDRIMLTLDAVASTRRPDPPPA